jgi:hypothetical protein
MTTLELRAEFKQLKSLLNEGLDSWKKAGELIANLIDSKQYTLVEIADAVNVSPLVIGKLESLGRNLIHSSLMIAAYPASSLLWKLPYSEQKEAVESGVTLLLESGDTLMVKAENLTRDQAVQVIGSSSLRGISAQRAWLEDSKGKALKLQKPLNAIYQIKGNNVIISSPCRLTRKDLMRMLTELEG